MDERRQRLVVAMLTAGYTVAAVWMMIPPHQRQSAKMRLVLAARRMLAGSAVRAGQAGMGAELATGRPEYTLPYLLSRGRDHLAATYERLAGA